MLFEDQTSQTTTGAAYLDRQIENFQGQFPDDFGRLSLVGAREAAKEWLSRSMVQVDLDAPLHEEQRQLIQKAAYSGLGAVERKARLSGPSAAPIDPGSDSV